MSLSPLPIPDRETSTTCHHPAIDSKVGEQFRRSNYCALRDISCVTSNGVVCLIGLLPSHYLKQIAQEIASSVEGVSQVVNRIEVVRPNALTPRAPGQPANQSWNKSSIVSEIVFSEHTTD